MGATRGGPKAVLPFASFPPTFSEMGKSLSSRKKKSQPETSATSSPEKGARSPAKPTKDLSQEESQKVIDDLRAKLDAASAKNPKSGKTKRSPIGAADSTTDEDEPSEETEKPSDELPPTSKSGSKSTTFSKLGNRAQKARKLFKDKDEEEEFRKWKESKGKPVQAMPVQPVIPLQNDEALARCLFFDLLIFS